jgi:hypothetical protein
VHAFFLIHKIQDSISTIQRKPPIKKYTKNVKTSPTTFENNSHTAFLHTSIQTQVFFLKLCRTFNPCNVANNSQNPKLDVVVVDSIQT